MKTLKYTTCLVGIALSTLFVNCSNDDDTPELINEEEEITRVTFELTSNNTTTSYTWNEDDTNFTLPLAANSSYQVAISFFNASDPSDVEEINPEVIEEADEHQVFFENSSSAVTISSSSADNQDSAGNPLGLKTTWTTSGAGNAVVRLFLIHEPSTKTGTSRADFEGETDVQVDINVAVSN